MNITSSYPCVSEPCQLGSVSLCNKRSRFVGHLPMKLRLLWAWNALEKNDRSYSPLSVTCHDPQSVQPLVHTSRGVRRLGGTITKEVDHAHWCVSHDIAGGRNAKVLLARLHVTHFSTYLAHIVLHALLTPGGFVRVGQVFSALFGLPIVFGRRAPIAIKERRSCVAV